MATAGLHQEATCMVSGLPDATRVLFDGERVVANAGVLVPAVLAGRLGVEVLVDEIVDFGDRPGAANPGRKVMTMVSAMALAGGGLCGIEQQCRGDFTPVSLDER